ncbi:MAG: diacylglycerol kinase family lipid kinase [Lachnospiraceae bacterium]|nr:diacylglycerol kinase family lipid kinase [Lachnospiraceae bacterium]
MIDFIVNETSGTGKSKGLWKEIEERLRNAGIEYRAHVTEYPGHTTVLARQITSEPGEKTVIVVGGDGTANETVNGIVDFDRTRFGYVPTGSGNDLGRGLSIRRNPADQALHLSTSKEEIKMDLGEVTTEKGEKRLFNISAGLGLDASVCKHALTSPLKKMLNKIKMGSATYAILTLKHLFYDKPADGMYTITDAGGSKTTGNTKNLIFAAAMNFSCEGGGVPMAPEAVCTDGLLDLTSAKDMPRFLCFCYFPFLIAGKQERIRKFTMLKFKTITFRLKSPMAVHADGEYLGDMCTVSFGAVPGKLRVIV